MKSLFRVRSLRLLAVVATLIASYGAVRGEEAKPWPREIDTEKGTIVIYQPQFESFENDKLSARSAVMLKLKDRSEPVFGAMWYVGRVSTDRDTRMVHLDTLIVTDVKFPNAKDKNFVEFKKIVSDAAMAADMSFSLDAVLAELDLVEKKKAAAEGLKSDPPRIIFKTEPSALVLIDGEPNLRELEGTKYKYVVNTPFFIVQDPSMRTFYLKGGEYWYTAQDVKGDWQATANPPSDLVEIAKKTVKEAEQQSAGGEQTPAAEGAEAKAEEPAKPVAPPKIVVATQPTELIQSNGKPEYSPVKGTNLLYMSNSEDDIILDIATQTHYVLISGRWYATKSLTDGPWAFVRPDKLPKDFQNIPSDSDVASVRSNVAGTEEAREAVLETEVPQTAAVSRKDATVTVKYDGDPKFEKIENTKVSYAVNSDKSVLRIDDKYYCCDNAVWFASGRPSGPWEVCVSVPEEVQDIPPSAPVYNVKYVYVYDYTPEVVYVGYTPGYVGCYPYYGCVVYGTGYYYHPWYGYYYYPRPVTYGFGVHYNPWTGWGFTFGMSWGWFSVGFSTYPGGWWGPAGYHNGYRHGYYHGYHQGYWQGYRQGAQAGARPTPYKRPAATPSQNIYKQRDGVRYTGDARQKDLAGRQPSTSDRTAPGRQPATADRAPAGKPSTGAVGATPADRSRQELNKPSQTPARTNDLYTDKNGDVYRKADKGWEQQGKDGWQSMDSQKQARDRADAQRTKDQLNRQYDARQRGDSRTQSYQQRTPTKSTPSTTRSPSRSPSRGGGGRRR